MIKLRRSQPGAIQHGKQYRLPGRGPIQSFPFNFCPFFLKLRHYRIYSTLVERIVKRCMEATEVLYGNNTTGVSEFRDII